MKPDGTADESELGRLREALRDRHSIDHLARAWTSGLIFILLVGIWVKLQHDSLGHPLFLWPGALLCLAVLGNVVRELVVGFRLLGVDRARLQRVRDLESQGPAPRELF